MNWGAQESWSYHAKRYSKAEIRGTYIDDDLVDELENVAHEHDGDDVPVDLAAQGLQVDSIRLRIGMRMKILVGIIKIAATGVSRGRVDAAAVERLYLLAGHHRLLIDLGHW